MQLCAARRVRRSRSDSALRASSFTRNDNGIDTRTVLRAGREDLIRDASGQEIRREYDDAGNMVAGTRPDGSVKQWKYDPVLKKAVRIVDARGAVTLMSYDANGNLTNKIEAAGTPIARTNPWVYNELNQLLRRIDARGNGMDYTYDERGNLVREYDPANPSYQTHYAYDARGNRTAVTNALGHVTRYGYDALDRLIAETNALGHVTLYTYDGNNLVEVETGRDGANRGRIVRYRYDDHGRRTQTLRVDEQGQEHVWETTSYDGDGRVIAVGQRPRPDHPLRVRRPRPAREDRPPFQRHRDLGHPLRVRRCRAARARDRPAGRDHRIRLRRDGSRTEGHRSRRHRRPAFARARLRPDRQPDQPSPTPTAPTPSPRSTTTTC